jgi:hypothetical protein
MMSDECGRPYHSSRITHHSSLMKKLFSRENLLALGLCFIIILLIIVSSDSAPQWIYQGF